MAGNIQIGALISGSGSNLQAIIDACEAAQIPGKVVFVGADKDNIQGLERARRHNIDTFVVDYKTILHEYRKAPEQVLPPNDFDLDEMRTKQQIAPGGDSKKIDDFLITRAIAEAKLLALMAPYEMDLLVLAGFMRNLTPYFIDRVNIDPARPRIMNIHPALLPAFPGVDGYGDTFRYGCKVGGCTVHFVDYGEDSGPIIGQKCFPITEHDTLDSIRKKGLEQEWRLYPECIRLFAEDRLLTVTRTDTVDRKEVRQRRVVQIASKDRLT